MCNRLRRLLWYKRLPFTTLQWRHMGVMAFEITNNSFFVQSFVQAYIIENVKVPRYWTFVRGIHRWWVDSPYKGPAMHTMSHDFRRVLSLIIIVKSEVWPICHCLGLGHETIVCAVCLSTFLLGTVLLADDHTNEGWGGKSNYSAFSTQRVKFFMSHQHNNENDFFFTFALLNNHLITTIWEIRI